MALRTSASAVFARFSLAPPPIHLLMAWRVASLNVITVMVKTKLTTRTLSRDLEATARTQKPRLSFKLLKDLVAWNDESGSYKYTLPPQLLNKTSL
jgi:hypothetical protein